MGRTQFEPGTHVSVLTKWGIRHHGIAGKNGAFYQNDNRTGKSGFRLAKAADFYRDAVEGSERAEPQRFTPAQALLRAKEKASWGAQTYHLALDNCEHAAREVADGVRRSDQVNALAFGFGLLPWMTTVMMMQVGADLVSGRATNVYRLAKATSGR